MTITNSTFENSSLTLLTATNSKQISIYNSSFRNLSPGTAALIYIKDVAPGGNSTHLIQDTSFVDIAIPHTIILLERNNPQLTMRRVTMTNLTKVTIGLTEDFDYPNEWPGGVCTLSRNDATIRIIDSNFTNISFHCFGLKTSTVLVAGSIFDNRNLNVPEPSVSNVSLDSLNDNSGITWISLQDTTTISSFGYYVNLTGNKFMQSKMVPKYGGVNTIYFDLLYLYNRH